MRLPQNADPKTVWRYGWLYLSKLSGVSGFPRWFLVLASLVGDVYWFLLGRGGAVPTGQHSSAVLGDPSYGSVLLLRVSN